MRSVILKMPFSRPKHKHILLTMIYKRAAHTYISEAGTRECAALFSFKNCHYLKSSSIRYRCPKLKNLNTDHLFSINQLFRLFFLSSILICANEWYSKHKPIQLQHQLTDESTNNFNQCCIFPSFHCSCLPCIHTHLCFYWFCIITIELKYCHNNRCTPWQIL